MSHPQRRTRPRSDVSALPSQGDGLLLGRRVKQPSDYGEVSSLVPTPGLRQALREAAELHLQARRDKAGQEEITRLRTALDVLILVARDERSWSLQEIARATLTDTGSIAKRLTILHDRKGSQ